MIEDRVFLGAGIRTIDDKELIWRDPDHETALCPPTFRAGCKVGSGVTVLAGVTVGAGPADRGRQTQPVQFPPVLVRHVLPRSEWKIAPFGMRMLRAAISTASQLEMSEVAKLESTGEPESDVSTMETDGPARLPAPEAAAASMLALIVLVVGAVVSMLLRNLSRSCLNDLDRFRCGTTAARPRR
jgi:hypothetical protein